MFLYKCSKYRCQPQLLFLRHCPPYFFFFETISLTETKAGQIGQVCKSSWSVSPGDLPLSTFMVLGLQAPIISENYMLIPCQIQTHTHIFL